MRRQALVVSVVLLTILAGCNAFISGGSGPGAGTDLPPVADQSWTDGEQVAFQQVMANQRSLVVNATSVRHTFRFVAMDGTTTREVLSTNRSSQRLNLSISVSGPETEQSQATFVADGTMYSKMNGENGPQYGQREDEVSTEQFESIIRGQAQPRFGAQTLEQWNFEYVGTTNGAYHFEADNLRSNATTVLGFGAEYVTTSNATLVIDERGFVRQISVSMTLEHNGETNSVRMSSAYAGVNETTVSEPSWTDEAENA